ncbi:MAG TPA: antitoxin [Alphaproteobacteria bacterium]|nr:antitoxin [Alphaproteobacteria bacterium]HAJ48134.1 antitoxin [Alphaproteobacteria bacterium]
MNVRSKFRRVGGSTMIAVPPAMLEALGLAPGEEVSMEAKGGKLVITPVAEAAPTLADLMNQCDPKAKPPRADKAWTDGAPKGRELI